MFGAFIRFRNSSQLAAVSRRAHQGFDYIAFLVVSFAVALLLFLSLTFMVCKLEIMRAAREWSSFLRHYEGASHAERGPVNVVLLMALCLLTGLVIAIRWPAAKRGWAVAPWASDTTTAAIENGQIAP